jgi:hypothetical protein
MMEMSMKIVAKVTKIRWDWTDEFGRKVPKADRRSALLGQFRKMPNKARLGFACCHVTDEDVVDLLSDAHGWLIESCTISYSLDTDAEGT